MSRWVRALGFSAAAGALILAFYLVHPIAGGHRLPIGPDGPVYVWWTRYAQVEGIGVFPGRFGVPAAALVLGSVFRTEAIQTIALLGPVLAAATGLAAAAVVERLLGPSLPREVAAAVLTAAWAGHLAAGYLGSLALAALFLSAIGAFGLAEKAWRGAALGGGLIATAAVSHRPLLFLPLAILAGAVVALVPDALRRRREGAPALSTAAGRVTAGALAGGAVGVGLGIVAGRGASRLLVDTAQDGFLRRHGLGSILRDLFRRRLAADGSRAAVPVAIGAALGAVGGARGAWGRSSEARFFRAVCGSWALLSFGGVAILAATGGPASRLITFAFFIPLVAAIGVDALVRRGGARVFLGVVAALIISVVAVLGWYRQDPYIEREELEAVEEAAETIGALAPGTPLVFLVDTEAGSAAFHVTRFGNVLRSSVPEERIADVRLAVGRPEDYLAGRPTITGDREHDRLSASYLAESRTPGVASTVLVLRPFNRPGYRSATRMGITVAPGVVALRGVATTTGSQAGPSARIDPADANGLGPAALAAMSIGALAVLALLGAGWARWGLPGAALPAVVTAAPSVGVATLILGAVAAESVGVPPGGLGGIAAAILVSAVGYAAALHARRHLVD